MPRLRPHLAALLAAAVFSPSSVVAQSTSLVSVGLGGAPSNYHSDRPSISADGRFVVFDSLADNLDLGDVNGRRDVFMHDRVTGVSIIVSAKSNGAQGNAHSREGRISPDGRIVAFASWASNFAPNDSNDRSDVFAHDTVTRQTKRVSLKPSGAEFVARCEHPALSADGRFVAFVAGDSDDVGGDPYSQVYLHDRQNSTTELISATATGAQGGNHSSEPALSADGRFVAFTTSATNLLPMTPGTWRVALRDRLLGTLSDVSRADGGGFLNGGAGGTAISADARFIAFRSDATNAAPADTNTMMDVFVHDRVTLATTLESVSSSGVQANSACYGLSLSVDGRFMSFYTKAWNLVPGDSGANTYDVFLRDRSAGLTVLASVDLNGQSSNGGSESFGAALSADGRFVAFSSHASDLVPGDTNGWSDVFVRDAFAACYLDADQDGFGAGSANSSALTCAPGFAPTGNDCDDTRALVYPGAPELCDGLDNDCNGAVDDSVVATYCTAGVSAQGCTATIFGAGAPSASANSGFVIGATDAPGQRTGLALYGVQPDAAVLSVGSTSLLCVSAPRQRMGAPTSSGGTNGACDGALSFDWNAWRAANPSALGSPFLAGELFYAQIWYRDPGAPSAANLSDGLRFRLCH